MYNGEVISVTPNVSSPNILKGFRLNFVLGGGYTKIYRENLILVRIGPICISQTL
jgi:hypothetical protein